MLSRGGYHHVTQGQLERLESRLHVLRGLICPAATAGGGVGVLQSEQKSRGTAVRGLAMATSSAAASVLVRPESIPPHPRRRGLLRNEPRGIRDRLLSIDRDVGFVHAVAALFARPVVANERCGSWYVRPGLKRGSSYFKSTDGHFGQCCFNLRRLNAHLLDIVVHGDGCIIVDSTRRGKSMPDALSKTIPIWCAVLNRTLFPGLVHSSDRAGVEEYHRFYTPPDCISASEDSQIEARIDGFVESLKACVPCSNRL